MPDLIQAGAYCVGDDVKALEIMPTRFKSSNALSDAELAQAAFADLDPGFSAKAQAGEGMLPFGRNSGVTATDVAIGCTAMLEAVNLALFELGAWQNMSSVGRIKYDESATERY